MRASQVIKKKGRHPNPPPFESFTFKRHYVVTCAQTPDQVWTETVANMGTEIKKEFNDYDWSEAPNPELCNVASAQPGVHAQHEPRRTCQRSRGLPKDCKLPLRRAALERLARLAVADQLRPHIHLDCVRQHIGPTA